MQLTIKNLVVSMVVGTIGFTPAYGATTPNPRPPIAVGQASTATNTYKTSSSPQSSLISVIDPTPQINIGVWDAFNIQGNAILDEALQKLATCESQGNPAAINENDHGSPSYGLFQYKEPTWTRYVNKYGLITAESGSKDPMDHIFEKETQIHLTALILKEKDGWKNWYNCSRKNGIDKMIQTVYNRMDGKILSDLQSTEGYGQLLFQ